MAFSRRISVVFLLITLLSASPAAFAQKAGKSATFNFGNVGGVTAKQLREYLTFIASDELEGRDTPSRGLDIAAMFIAQHLSAWGIKPAGDGGTYFQKVPLTMSKVVTTETRLDIGGQTYEYGKDFLTTLLPADISNAPIVFAGYGWVVKAKNIDPYTGIDVKDKVVVVVNNLPKGVTNADLQGKLGEDWMSPPYYAQTHGAKAVITFPSFNGLALWDQSRWNQSEKGAVSFGSQAPLIKIPSINATPRMLAAIFAGEKFSANNLFNKAQVQDTLEAFDLKPEKRVSGAVRVRSSEVHTQNVVGVLEGSDPVLKNEYVAIGAHYDHVGTSPFFPGADKIWNGADDDGSGTVSVLNIAQAFASGAVRPKRSMLFIWHAGEEKGLWGSEYFTDHPTVPITNVITELNIDMIGRFQNPGDENHPVNRELPKPNEIFTIGNSMMSTELGQIADEVNNAYLKLNYNPKYADPKDPNQYFYRSDHYNYARKGVPIIFFMDGTHADYHQPSDSIEKINFEQMEKVARTIMATGWTLANRDKRPFVDKPLPASVAGQ
jgi:peptidase M28-like protein